jgi:hypothetical protein
MSDMSQAVHDTTDYISPLLEHIVTEQLSKKRPKEIRISHRTVVLTAANPVQQLAGVDPDRVTVRLNVIENNAILTSSIAQASDLANTTTGLTFPNGRILASGTEYAIPGNANEIWLSGATYPTRIGVTIVREIGFALYGSSGGV